jgi:phage-related minor tail protein
MAESVLQIVVKLKDEATEKMSGIGRAIENNKEKISALGKSFTVAGAAITGFVGYAIKQAIEGERAMAIIRAQLENLPKAFLKAQGGVDALMKSIQDVSQEIAYTMGISDELVAKSLTKLVSITQDVSKANHLMQIAMDYSVASGRDLESVVSSLVALMTGKMGALRDFGIEFDRISEKVGKTTHTKYQLKAATGEIITALTEEEARQKALELIYSKVQGTAETVFGTTSGQLARLRAMWNDLMKTLGQAFLPILIDKVLPAITNVITKIRDWIDAHPELASKIMIVVAVIGGLLAVLGPILIILPGLISAFGILGSIIGALSGPVGAVIAVLAVLGWTAYKIIKDWDYWKENFIFMWNNIVNFIKGVVESIVNFFKTLPDRIWNFIKSIPEKILSVFRFPEITLPGWLKKLIPGLQVGTVYVPETGLYLLHRGEAVTPAYRAGRGISGVMVNVNILGGTYLDERASERFAQMLARELQYRLRI